jgi:hypothetical protein
MQTDIPLNNSISPGLFRVAYLLNGNQDKQISVAIYPDLNDLPLITLSKCGFQGVKLTAAEWEQIISYKECIELHLKGTGNTITSLDLGPYTRIKFFYSFGTPIVSIGPGDVTPPTNRGGSTTVCLSLTTWDDIIKVTSCINYAIKCREVWSPIIKNVYETIAREFTTTYKEPLDVDICGNNDVRQVVLDKVINDVLSNSKCEEKSFDLTMCLLETRRF